MPRPRTRDADLARRFVDAAVTIVLADGVGALTTRRASDTAGSNIAALHQLFGSREGLVDAVVAVGFERLADAARAARANLGPAAQLREFAYVYREFARSQPNLVDVMFARPVGMSNGVDLAGAFDMRTMLTDAVAELTGPAAGLDVDAAALGFVALVEGLALNERRGLLGGTVAADRVWAVAVRGALRGLAAGPTRC